MLKILKFLWKEIYYFAVNVMVKNSAKCSSNLCGDRGICGQTESVCFLLKLYLLRSSALF